MFGNLFSGLETGPISIRDMYSIFDQRWNKKTDPNLCMENILSDWTKQLQSGVHLSERLASLGIMQVQLSAHLIPVLPSQHYRIEGFMGGPQLGPHYDERR